MFRCGFVESRSVFQSNRRCCDAWDGRPKTDDVLLHKNRPFRFVAWSRRKVEFDLREIGLFISPPVSACFQQNTTDTLYSAFASKAKLGRRFVARQASSAPQSDCFLDARNSLIMSKGDHPPARPTVESPPPETRSRQQCLRPSRCVDPAPLSLRFASNGRAPAEKNHLQNRLGKRTDRVRTLLLDREAIRRTFTRFVAKLKVKAIGQYVDGGEHGVEELTNQWCEQTAGESRTGIADRKSGKDSR